jgi:hypothetical protein
MSIDSLGMVCSHSYPPPPIPANARKAMSRFIDGAKPQSIVPVAGKFRKSERYDSRLDDHQRGKEPATWPPSCPRYQTDGLVDVTQSDLSSKNTDQTHTVHRSKAANRKQIGCADIRSVMGFIEGTPDRTEKGGCNASWSRFQYYTIAKRKCTNHPKLRGKHRSIGQRESISYQPWRIG